MSPAGSPDTSPDDERHLGHACRLAVDSVAAGGGPFGAVVVRDGEVLGAGANEVTVRHDPTAHAEMAALRAAGAALATHDLTGCTLYASCRPCPMCMTAAWWARVDRVVFAASSALAAEAGFDDERFWEGVADASAAPVPPEHVGHPEARAPFEAWAAYEDRTPY